MRAAAHFHGHVYARVFSALALSAAVALLTCGVVSTAFAGPSTGAPSATPRPSGQATYPVVPNLVTQTIDETKLVTTSSRNVHPFATPQNDMGRVSDNLPMERIILLLMRSPEQKAALDAMVDQLHNRKSPIYHKWLTPEEVGRVYGPSDDDIATITSWLQSHGFTIDEVPAGRTHIIISGTAGQIRQTFHTEIHNYMVNGQMHVANNGEPQIPAALAPVIQGFRSLHDFVPQPAFRNPGVFQRNAKTGKWYPKAGQKMDPRAVDITQGTGSTEAWLVGPQDWYTIYGENSLLNSGITGAGQTIAVIEETDITQGDVATFRSQFSLPTYPSTPNNTQGGVNWLQGANGACTDPGILTNGEEPEADLDVQWAGVTAPAATIDFVSCKTTSTTAGIDLAASYIINSLSSTVSSMSLSYGVCETNLTGTGASYGIYQADSYYNKLWEQAAAQGQTVVVSSGDSGSEGCDQNVTVSNHTGNTHGLQVSGMESTPYNVSAGGTDFSDTFNGTNSTYWNSNDTQPYESALSYVPETPWSSYCANPLFLQYAITNDGFPSTETLPAFCVALRSDGTEYDDVVGGSGGQSNCATGSPTTAGLVGGSCAGYAKPSWQSMYGMPADGVRDVPDLSFFASSGWWSHYLVFCDSAAAACNYSNTTDTGDLGAGGTSFVAPQINGIMALIGQQTGSWQGQADYTLYAMAANEFGAAGSSGNSANLTSCNANEGNSIGSSCVFYDIGPTYDIATGSYIAAANSQPCNTASGTTTETPCYKGSSAIGVSSTSSTTENNAWAATAGYDYATGIGSANVTNLVTNWNSYGASFATATSINANPTTLTSSQSTTLTATVSTTGRGGISAASGTVQFYIGSTTGTELGTGNLTSTCTGTQPNVVCTASATLSVPATSLNAGSNSIIAYFPGDAANDAASTSSPVSVDYQQPQTISCSNIPASAANGSSFTVSCNATSNLAVVYSSSGGCSNSGATYNMISGSMACTVIANQPGNASYLAAPQFTQSVAAAPGSTSISVTSVSPSNEDYAADSPVTITAALSWSGNGAAPTAANVVISGNGNGTYGATSCGSPSSDTMTCTATYTPTTADTPGTYTESAAFSADSNYAASSSSQSNNFTINTATSTTTVTSGTDPSVYGSPVTFTATVSGENGFVTKHPAVKRANATKTPDPTGTVTWSTNTGCGPTAVSGNPGVATCTTSSLGGGSDTVMASYAGDANHGASSGSVVQTVNPASQTITFTTNPPASAAFNSQFTVAATASSGLMVYFHASGACTHSAATYTMTSGTGTCTVTATQQGNSNYSAATPVVDSVSATQVSTSISVTSVNPSSEDYGSATPVAITAVLTWTGSGAAPTAANVTIGGNGTSGSYGTTSCGAASGNSMTCSNTYTPNNDAPGAYTESAAFSGDSNYTGSNSSQSGNFIINAASTTTSVSSGTNPSVYGTSVTFTATVTGENGDVKRLLVKRANVRKTPDPTGSVTWSANTGCGTTAVSGNPGVATCTTSSLGAGSDTVTASYPGDANHTASSGSVIQNVSQASQTITFTMNPPANAAYNSQFMVAATGGASGNPVTFTSAGACTNSGATYTMTSGTGTCSVIANQAGNTNYSAASQVTKTANATKIDPTVTFTGLPASLPYDSVHTLAATTNASTTATFTNNSPTVCSLSAKKVTIVYDSGTCSVTAKWAADNNYNAATASQSGTAVQAKAVITWTTPSPITYGTALSATQLDATATPANVYPTAVYVPAAGTYLKAGSATLKATFTPQGNSNYAATSHEVTLAVAQQPTSTAFTTGNETINEGTNGVVATVVKAVVSGYKPTGAVTLTASTGETCSGTVTESTGDVSCKLTFTSVGSRTISASYSGDANHTGSSIENAITITVNPHP